VVIVYGGREGSHMGLSTVGATDRRFVVDWQKVRIYMALRNIETEGDLGKRAELNRETIVMLKKGERPFASDTVAKLALALDCNPMDILKTEGFPAPHLDAPVIAATY
jgi:DNA-binding Xre family transcriptional regulator